jgi:hypothetical protein
MDLYCTDFEHADVRRRNDARSVDAWIRAAAYAAGEDPEALFAARPEAPLFDQTAQPELDLLV